LSYRSVCGRLSRRIACTGRIGPRIQVPGGFRDPARLNIRNKGIQDQVSDGDVAVERFVRSALLKAFPEDGIVGEEEGLMVSKSGFTWVIDPVDGTYNFVRGAPGWAVVLSCVNESDSLIGVIHDPIANESFTAVRNQGCRLNGTPVNISTSQSLDDGCIGVGMSTRVPTDQVIGTLERITEANGVYYRSGSGALNLAYVAAGRLSGYCEPHMNAWDCLAGMMMIEEAGGQVESFDMPVMLEQGGRVIAACPGVYDKLHSICLEKFCSPAAISDADV